MLYYIISYCIFVEFFILIQQTTNRQSDQEQTSIVDRSKWEEHGICLVNRFIYLFIFFCVSHPLSIRLLYKWNEHNNLFEMNNTIQVDFLLKRKKGRKWRRKRRNLTLMMKRTKVATMYITTHREKKEKSEIKKPEW